VIRTLFAMPGPVDWHKLSAEVRPLVSDLISCNQVADLVAVYSSTAIADETAVAAVVAAHTGPPEWPALDAVGALATLLAVTEVLTVTDAANAVGEEPAHLEHEALSWSIGGV
jgi:hypothetical protein